jgi:hypothetical protein
MFNLINSLKNVANYIFYAAKPSNNYKKMFDTILVIESMKTKITRDRKVRKGYDLEKLTRIWKDLSENSGYWLHVAELSRITGMNECTIRIYLNKSLKDATEEQKILPGIKLRLVRLKPDMDIGSYIKALNYIEDIKSGQKKQPMP